MVLDCPHCKAESVGFAFGGEHPQDGSPLGHPIWNTLFECRKCHAGVVVELQNKSPVPAAPSACHGDPSDERFTVLAVYPKPQPLDVPEHLPKEIAGDYSQAADSLRRLNFTAAGMMFRKVLQRATTALAATAEPKITVQRLKLHARIDKLADCHVITPAMREWAHQIRDDGNEANHEEDVVFEQSDAEQMQAFTELFLIYAFTLPERVRLARGADADQDA